MNCKNAEKLILSGKTSPLLEKHLKSCAACSACKKELEKIRQTYELCRNSKNVMVPVSLDLSIKAAARSRNTADSIRSATKNRKLWLTRISSQAAVFAICFAVYWVSDSGAVLSEDQGEPVLAMSQTATDEKDEDLSLLDFYSEVAELSFDLEYSTNGNSLDYNDLVLTQLNSSVWFNDEL